jgi:hypothetical protein
MTTFPITEDFPKREVEFHPRLSDPKHVASICSSKNGGGVLYVKDAVINNTCTVNVTFAFATICQHQHSLTAVTHNRQLEITDYPLVQGHVVVHHPKSGINGVNLKDLTGFGSYGTAWTWLQ